MIDKHSIAASFCFLVAAVSACALWTFILSGSNDVMPFMLGDLGMCLGASSGVMVLCHKQDMALPPIHDPLLLEAEKEVDDFLKDNV